MSGREALEHVVVSDPDFLMDSSLFFFINSFDHNALFDVIMPFITEKPYLLFLVVVIYPAMKDRRKAVPFLVISLIGLLFSDMSGNLLKHLFERPRPCSGLEEVRLLVTCGHSFSFPSNHAVNAFAVAAIGSYFYRKSAPLFYLIAAAVAFSRIYVGVHYPSDVFVGAIWGILCSYMVLSIYSQYYEKRAPVFSG